jgi:hypothetical protein
MRAVKVGIEACLLESDPIGDVALGRHTGFHAIEGLWRKDRIRLSMPVHGSVAPCEPSILPVVNRERKMVAVTASGSGQRPSV